MGLRDREIDTGSDAFSMSVLSDEIVKDSLILKKMTPMRHIDRFFVMPPE